jgi:ABC-2 type transport system permease protein
MKSDNLKQNLQTTLRNIGIITAREFKTIVFTKSYLASIFLVPLVVFLTLVLAFSLQFINIASKPQLRTVILDNTDRLSNFITTNNTDFSVRLNFKIYEESKIKDDKKIQTLDKIKVKVLPAKDFRIESLKAQIKDQKLEGILIIPTDFFENSKVTYIARNNLTGSLPPRMKQMLEAFRLNRLRAQLKISQEELGQILKPIDVNSVSVIVERDKGKPKDSISLRLLAAAAIYGILSICIAIHGSKLTMSILEERRSKVMEVLLSAVKPIEFMWGKILGSTLAAVLQTGIWSAMLFFAFIKSGAAVFEITARTIVKSGASGQVLDPTGGTELVQNAVNESANIAMLDQPQIPINGEMLLYLIIFSVAGFLLYATIFAAIGAIANSVTEAQYLETPLVFLMLFPTYLFLPLIENPSGKVIVYSSFFPYFTPFVLYSRICVDEVPFFQIALGLGLLLLAIAVNIFFVSVIYKTSLLLYGKKITAGELWKMFKYSLGS